MTTINGCRMRHASLGQGGTGPTAGYLLHSLLGRRQTIHQARPSSVYQFFQRARRVTPPSDAAATLRVRRLCLRPRRSSFAVAGNHAAAAAQSFLRVRPPLIGLHTDRPSTSAFVDASICLGYLQRMIRITARVKRQFVLESSQSVQSKLLDSPFKFQKTRGRYQNKIELGCSAFQSAIASESASARPIPFPTHSS